MKSEQNSTITVQAKINAPIDKVWKCWTTPGDIMNWNHASNDWHTPHVENDLHLGGRFSFRMEAKNGSAGFDFGGKYEKVIINKRIEYIIDDGRRVSVVFSASDNKTDVLETFETESVNGIELQRTGWQAILDNFKKYTEENYS